MKGGHCPLFYYFATMIAEKIKAAREAKGLSTEHVAAHLGISPEGYKSLENGENTPSTQQLIKIAEVVGVNPMEWLLDTFARNVFYTNSGDIGDDSSGHVVNDLSLLESYFKEMQVQQSQINQDLLAALTEMQMQQREFMDFIKVLLEKR